MARSKVVKKVTVYRWVVMYTKNPVQMILGAIDRACLNDLWFVSKNYDKDNENIKVKITIERLSKPQRKKGK